MQRAVKSGRRVTVYWQAVSPHEVLTNTVQDTRNPAQRLAGLRQCHRQQRHAAQNGGDFDAECWECGATVKTLCTWMSLARELLPTNENLYRLKR